MTRIKISTNLLKIIFVLFFLIINIFWIFKYDLPKLKPVNSKINYEDKSSNFILKNELNNDINFKDIIEKKTKKFFIFFVESTWASCENELVKFKSTLEKINSKNIELFIVSPHEVDYNLKIKEHVGLNGMFLSDREGKSVYYSELFHEKGEFIPGVCIYDENGKILFKKVTDKYIDLKDDVLEYLK